MKFSKYVYQFESHNKWKKVQNKKLCWLLSNSSHYLEGAGHIFLVVALKSPRITTGPVTLIFCTGVAVIIISNKKKSIFIKLHSFWKSMGGLK